MIRFFMGGTLRALCDLMESIRRLYFSLSHRLRKNRFQPWRDARATQPAKRYRQPNVHSG
jgi:hypothetical protein